jgi:A/G-specific adenine glycosylase
MDSRYFSKKVVEWYQKNKRTLPWRDTSDPYKVWLSEIILQQTRVQQGLPYYKQFVKKFPTVRALAQASEEQVLRAWQGLGYYTRARNLHRCARLVRTRHNGKFPDSYSALLTLPGIGQYTAAAIASICYNEPVAVVDGNVFRVLARVFGIHQPINTSAGKKIFSDLANSLIPETQPALFNQAIMEFGALHCTPRNPFCADCIFKKQCVAYAGNLQAVLPVKQKKKSVRTRHFTYVVFRSDNALFMKKRSGNDIWKGLYDFYLIETPRPLLKPEQMLKKEIGTNYFNGEGFTRFHHQYKHVLSHQVVLARFMVTNAVPAKHLGLTKFTRKTIETLPKPTLITRFLKDAELL